MNKDKIIEIIVSNLKKQLERNGKTQQDIANDLGYSKSTVNSWFTGYRIPRMDKIDQLCEYFHCTRSDILDTPGDKKKYYSDDETTQIAQEIFENKDLRLLFDSARDSSPEDLKAVHEMLLALKRKEQHDD